MDASIDQYRSIQLVHLNYMYRYNLDVSILYASIYLSISSMHLNYIYAYHFKCTTHPLTCYIDASRLYLCMQFRCINWDSYDLNASILDACIDLLYQCI